MICLGLETSCDETSVALVRDGWEVLANLIASQIDLHRVYGGVVPELACRKHLEVLNPLLEQALKQANLGWKDVDAISVTSGPGLIGALLVGIAAAKALAWTLGIPLIGVNHLEGHVYANFLERPDLPFPVVCLLVSGGHTILLYSPEHGQYEKLGETRDDAAGEAFDKVARVLNLGYPGGPVIDRLAQQGDGTRIKFPRGMMAHPGYDFSFSGLKTAVINFVRQEKDGAFSVPDICASFQDAVVDVLVAKTVRAAKDRGAATVLMAGGVACNSALRQRLRQGCEKAGLSLHYPSPVMCTDNAAMIACVGTYRLQRGQFSALNLDADSSLGFEVAAEKERSLLQGA